MSQLSSLFGVFLGTAIAAGLAPAQINPNVVLRVPDLVASPGQTVTVPVMLDNGIGDIQGWSYSCNIASPLGIASETAGATTAALLGGAGPDFLAATIYNGQGYTVGCIISFFGLQVLPIGNGYELHTCQVTVPANAAPGTVYAIDFAAPALGNPPVATIAVMGGQSHVPTLIAGSITVGTPASVTPIASSDCPVPLMGDLVSLSNPGLGTTWSLQVQGIPSGATHGFYVYGLTLQPQSMAAFGSPCTMQVASDLLAFQLTAGSDLQSHSLNIPNVPAIIGAEIYVQATHDAAPTPPFSNFLGLPFAYYFTNTLLGTIGT